MEYKDIPKDQFVIRADYDLALASQSACNLSGIVKNLAVAMDRLWKEANHHKLGTEFVNEHPICRLYAEQIAHLSGAGPCANYETYAAASAFCKARLAEMSPPREFFAQACGGYMAIWNCAKPGIGEPLATIDLDPFPDTVLERVVETEKRLGGEITNYNKEDKKFYL